MNLTRICKVWLKAILSVSLIPLYKWSYSKDGGLMTYEIKILEKFCFFENCLLLNSVKFHN